MVHSRHFKLAESPRSNERGPIEDGRDRLHSARESRSPRSNERGPIEDTLRRAAVMSATPNLRALTSAAPLKNRSGSASEAREVRSPRSNERGPIEEKRGYKHLRHATQISAL